LCGLNRAVGHKVRPPCGPDLGFSWFLNVKPDFTQVSRPGWRVAAGMRAVRKAARLLGRVLLGGGTRPPVLAITSVFEDTPVTRLRVIFMIAKDLVRLCVPDAS
jgi:hypothetical protein